MKSLLSPTQQALVWELEAAGRRGMTALEIEDSSAMIASYAVPIYVYETNIRSPGLIVNVVGKGGGRPARYVLRHHLPSRATP